MPATSPPSPAASIRPARADDSPAIAALIRELAAYERLEAEARATAADIARHLFGAHPAAEALIAEVGGEPVGFALFFTNFSTFRRPAGPLPRRPLRPARAPGPRAGPGLAGRDRAPGGRAGLRPGRLGRARLERAVDRFLPLPGREPDGRLDGLPPRRPRPRRPRRPPPHRAPRMSGFFLDHIDRMAGYLPGEQPARAGLHQAQHEREPLPPLARGGPRHPRGPGRSAPAVSRPRRRPRSGGPPPTSTGSSPIGSSPATAPTTSSRS